MNGAAQGKFVHEQKKMRMYSQESWETWWYTHSCLWPHYPVIKQIILNPMKHTTTIIIKINLQNKHIACASICICRSHKASNWWLLRIFFHFFILLHCVFKKDKEWRYYRRKRETEEECSQVQKASDARGANAKKRWRNRPEEKTDEAWMMMTSDYGGA